MMTLTTIIFGLCATGMLGYALYRAWFTITWRNQQKRYHDQILTFRDIALSRAERESGIVTIFTEQGAAISDADFPDSWRFLLPGGRISPSVNAPKPVNSQEPAMQAAISLLEAMSGDGSFYIWGGRGSGKTHFTRALVARKVQDEGTQVIVVDPKPFRAGKWPESVLHIGADENFQECLKLEEFLDTEKARRREHYDRIETFPQLLVVCDELPTLNDEISIIDTLLPVIKFGRSYRMDVLLIAQGATNRSHGCVGQSDVLRESLDFIQMKYDRKTGERYALYESEGTDPVLMSVDVPMLPRAEVTPFTPFTPSETEGDSPAYPDENEEEGSRVRRVSIPLASVQPESEQEAEIIERYRMGQTPTKIRNDIFGGGGNQLKKVKAVLSKYGMLQN